MHGPAEGAPRGPEGGTAMRAVQAATCTHGESPLMEDTSVGQHPWGTCSLRAKGVPGLVETPGPLDPQPTTPSPWCSQKALPLAGGNQRSLRLRENCQVLRSTSRVDPGSPRGERLGRGVGVSPMFPRASLKDDPTHLSGTLGKKRLGKSYASPIASHPMPSITH